jgi:excisionase family DNA binding protein
MSAKLRVMTEPSATPAPPLATLLSVGAAKAAEMLGISRRTLVHLINSGEIKTSRVPSTRTGKPHMHLIKVTELEAFLDRNSTPVA